MSKNKYTIEAMQSMDRKLKHQRKEIETLKGDLKVQTKRLNNFSDKYNNEVTKNTELKEQLKEVDKLHIIDFINNNREVDFKRLTDKEIDDLVNYHLEMIKEVREQLDKERNEHLESLSNNN